MKTILLLVTSVILCFPASAASVETGKASFYSTSCNGGNKTASGQKLRNDAMTMAHKTLPFGTKVMVTNQKNGKSVECVVTDRGPFIRGRIIDVTIGVARKLGFVKSGITTVKIEVVGKIKK